MVRELMNRHQRTDKGLGGPAVGPEGSSVAERVFEAAGYHVRAGSRVTGHSGRPNRTFQRQLIEGGHTPPRDRTGAGRPSPTGLKRRLEHVEAGRSRIVVNHVDMLAWLSR